MIESMKLSTLLKRIRDKDDPFTFSRWGDGEWRSILKKHRKGATNCDGHTFYPEMGNELASVLIQNPTYMLGMQHLAMRLYGPPIQLFLKRHDLSHLRWVDSDVFHRGVIAGNQEEIVDAVQSRKLLLIGPPHLKCIKNSGLRYWKYVEVPPKNCYLNVQDL